MHPESVKSFCGEVETREGIDQISEEDWLERVKVINALRDAVIKQVNEANENQKNYYNKAKRSKF